MYVVACAFIYVGRSFFPRHLVLYVFSELVLYFYMYVCMYVCVLVLQLSLGVRYCVVTFSIYFSQLCRQFRRCLCPSFVWYFFSSRLRYVLSYVCAPFVIYLVRSAFISLFTQLFLSFVRVVSLCLQFVSLSSYVFLQLCRHFVPDFFIGSFVMCLVSSLVLQVVMYCCLYVVRCFVFLSYISQFVHLLCMQHARCFVRAFCRSLCLSSCSSCRYVCLSCLISLVRSFVISFFIDVFRPPFALSLVSSAFVEFGVWVVPYLLCPS